MEFLIFISIMFSVKTVSFYPYAVKTLVVLSKKVILESDFFSKVGLGLISLLVVSPYAVNNYGF